MRGRRDSGTIVAAWTMQFIVGTTVPWLEPRDTTDQVPILFTCNVPAISTLFSSSYVHFAAYAHTFSLVCFWETKKKLTYCTKFWESVKNAIGSGPGIIYNKNNIVSTLVVLLHKSSVFLLHCGWFWPYNKFYKLISNYLF